jgi:dTDP-4-dehydrorhamnose reductase
MRVLVTGRTGQLATALIALAEVERDVEVVAMGRPDFDLTRPAEAMRAVIAARPDVVVNAAAQTAVDQAESEPLLALAVNAVAAGAMAMAAAELGAPIIQISTDYVFDGSKPAPYLEGDPVGPLGAYGWSKLAGEAAVAGHAPNHAILRTSWVFAAEGRNFVRSMLRAAASRPEIGVVGDQRGCPTYAPDLAHAVLAVARNLVRQPGRTDMRGVFHVAGAGEADWAGFADAVFERARAKGGPAARVRRIATADYPTPARRPANSRLGCALVSERHGVVLPDWHDALDRCFERIRFD